MANHEREQVKQYVYGFIAAMQFLTIIPLPIKVPFDKPVLHKSVVFFPVVGVIIGIILSLLGIGLPYIMPTFLTSIVMVLCGILLSGGLHMDGLMDSADGLLSRRSSAEMLDIMKDSRVGSFGVLAAIFVITLKASALISIINLISEKQLSVAWLVLIIIGIFMWSRWWIVIAISSWKPARPGGLASLFHGLRPQYVSTSTALSLFIYLMAIMLYVLISSIHVYFVWLAILIPIVTAIIGWLMAKWMKLKLGGLTGDTYGAMTEVVEACMLVISVIFLHVLL